MKVLKMPQPLQVVGAPVVVVAEDLLSDVLVEGVGALISFDGYFYGSFGVSGM